MSTYKTDDIINVLQRLLDAKNQISERMSDLKVTVNVNQYPDIVAAVSGLFGPEYVSDGVAVITFDMVIKCMEVVRSAGIGKAQELIK